jgi:ADP-ribose pyrophosphatase
MNFEEKTKKENLIFDGKVLHVYCDDVICPNGNEATREYAKHLGAVCVVPLTAENEVICVKQYRYAHHRMFLEIPAGKLDYAGEDRREAALRELREETGAICETLTHIGDIVPSPAILTERISMYLAEGLTFGKTEYDEDEFIEIVRIPIEKLVEMIVNGEIEDAKTQSAILKVWYLKNK